MLSKLDVDFIRAKFDCQAEYVKRNGLKYAFHSWFLMRKKGIFQLDGSGYVYPLGLLIVGKSGLMNEYQTVCSTLGLNSITEVSALNTGIAMRDGGFASNTEEERTLFNLGKEIRNKIDPKSSKGLSLGSYFFHQQINQFR